ncbi:MAG: glycosyltransferase family 4 protein [Candidatus Zixiibacteriota bacterium]
MTGRADQIDTLFLTHNYPRHSTDFAGRFLARLALLLNQRGRAIGVLAPHGPGSAAEEEMDGVHVWRFRYAPDARETLAYRGDWGGVSILGDHGLWAHWRFFRSFDRATRMLLAAHRPSVVHAHWWVPAGWVARKHNRGNRLIVTLHGTDIRLLQMKPWLRLLAGRVFARAHIITTVSSWLSEFLQVTFPTAAAKVRVAPMPPEDEIFMPSATPRSVNDPPIILCVTRFTAQKRTGDLIEALSRLRDRGVRYRCRIVGEGGALRGQVVQEIAGRGLTSHVELVGSMAQDRLADEYRNADVTVLPAVDEGFGMALVEAQLCGCAVVGVRSGGLTDIIEDGESGLLARPRDPGDLADMLARVLPDPALRQRLAEKGRASARRRFSSAAIVDRFLGWYEWPQ